MAKKDKGTITGDPVTYQIPAPAGGVQMETFVPWTLVKRGVRRQVITPIDSPQQLIRALGLAHYWQRLLDDGKYRSLTEISDLEGLDLGRTSRMTQLTRLSPDIIQACLAGDCDGTTLQHLVRVTSFALWSDQSHRLSHTGKFDKCTGD